MTLKLVYCNQCDGKNTSNDKLCRSCGRLLSLGKGVLAPANLCEGPNLPVDLRLGEQASMWSTTRSIRCDVSSHDVQSGRRSSGTLSIDRCSFGLRIYVSSESYFIEIHYSQIAQAGYVAAVRIEEKNKSILGRAAIGAVLLGPVGAIVGGLTGTSKNVKTTSGLYIKFWEPKIHCYDVLSMESDSDYLRSFCTDIQNGAAQYRGLHK